MDPKADLLLDQVQVIFFAFGGGGVGVGVVVTVRLILGLQNLILLHKS